MESKEGTSTHPISKMASYDYTYSGKVPIQHSVIGNLAERPNTKRKFYNIEKESNKKRKTASEQYTQVCLQNDIGKVSIHMLNNDCLTHIFLFLPIMDRVRIERVCKRWRDLSQDSWYEMKKLDFLESTWGFVTDKISKYMFHKILLKCGRFLTQIDLSNANFLSKKNQSTIIQFMTIIEKLYLNLTNLESIIAQNCRNIRKLNLGRWCGGELKNLFKLNQNLEYFAINQCRVSGETLLYLPKKVHTIILDNCQPIDDIFFPMALQRLKNLKHLTITGCVFKRTVKIVDIAKRTLEVLGKHCKNLAVLELWYGGFVSVKTTDMLHLFHLVNLQVLKIIYNPNVTDKFLANLVKRCQQLVSLDITGCRKVSNNGLNAIAALLKLEKLTISYIPTINHGLLNMCNLKELECRRCRRFTDQGISMFIKSSLQLELLDLSGCRSITEFILEAAKDTCDTRPNNIMLKMIVGGTSIDPNRKIHQKYASSLLQIVNVDLSSKVHNWPESLLFESRLFM